MDRRGRACWGPALDCAFEPRRWYWLKLHKKCAAPRPSELRFEAVAPKEP